MSDWVVQVREGARRALAPMEGEVAVRGLREPVEVIRDRWGVPHIYAASLDDLFFAQGFVIASERLFQIDLMLRAANGRLSTMFSELMLPLDRFARTAGWNRAGARVARGYDERSRAISGAFRAGVHAWIDAMAAPPVEYQVLDLEPMFPAGQEAEAYWASSAVFMAWSLSGNFDNELLRAEIAERLGWETMLSLFPGLPTEPQVVTAGKRDGRRTALELLKAAPHRPPGRGSNNWVVAGSRTVTGKPLLANDPHLVVQTPSIWFECHLSTPGYEVSGVTLPFSPGVVIGHTAHHAWGFTNVGGDTQDLYLERLNEDRTAALYEGTWEPLAVHQEAIDVRGRDEPEVLQVRETRHGPILDSYVVGIAEPKVVDGGIAETYALRWTGHDHAVLPSMVLDMAVARDFEEFRNGVRGWDAPGQNMVYADVDGTIGYQCTGLYPVRRKGDGTTPVPGWTSEHEWDGFIPFEELPWSVDPDEGFLVTANQKIHDDSYPHLIGRDFPPPYRARRISELITATEKHSRETFARMQVDTVSLSAREILPHLLEVEPADERQKEALSHLAGWDGDLAAGSAAACVYEAWSTHIAEVMLLPRLGRELFTHYHALRESGSAFQFQVLPNLLAYPSAAWFEADGVAPRDDALRSALARALDELTAALGEDISGWRWGALHRVRFAAPLAMIHDVEELFAAGIVEAGGDAQTINQSAFEPGSGYGVAVLASWRQIIDLADVDASLGVLTTGQSGNPLSPHWNDQMELWARGEYHPLPFTRPAVEAHAASTMTLSPR